MNLLGAAPWRRAPVLLLRQPLVAVAIALASAVLAVAASSGVLFLSTVGTASLQAQARADCPEASLPSASTVVAPPAVAATRTSGTGQLQASGLPSPYSVEIARAQIQASPIEMISRPGASDHLVKLSGSDGPGAWFPDDFAAKIGARPGDRVQTTDGKSILVAGIYRSMGTTPFALSGLPRYWCTWEDLFVPAVVEHPTGPVLITDEATITGVAAQNEVSISWYGPVDVEQTSLPVLTRDQHRVVQAAAALRGRGVPAQANLDLAQKLDAAHSAQQGISGPVVPIDIAAILVAGLLVAGAGGFWSTHRAREIRLLTARGVSPLALAAKAVLETAPAAVLGLIAGVASAIALIGSVGPTSVLGPGTALRASLAAAAATAVGLLLIAGIATVSGRERTAGVRRRWWLQLPWEVLPGAVAIALGLAIGTHSQVQLAHNVVRVDTAGFVFPLLAAVALLVLLGRTLGAVLPRAVRARSHAKSPGRFGIARFLALRQLAGSRAIAVGLLIGTALPCGLLTYADMVSSGVSQQITAKYQTNLGADHVLEVVGPELGTPRLAGHGTTVSVIQTDPVVADGTHLRILGVDPSTFAAFAFTDGGQRSQLSRLTPVAAGRPVPAIMVNGPGESPDSVQVATSKLDVDLTAHDRVFPGLRDGYQPMLVVNRQSLARLDPDIDRATQVWTTNAQYPAALAALNTDPNYHVLVELSSQVLVGNTGLLPLKWILGYLRALAVLIGLVALTGLVFALAARTRRRTVSYVLSRRMGLSRRAHLRSLLVELGAVVGLGWALGAAVGIGADAVIFRQLDIYPSLPPPPGFALPGGTLGLTAAIVVGVVIAAAVGAQLMAERARPAEILRLE